MPAPLTMITFFALAIVTETSSSLRRAGKSAWSVDASSRARSRCAMVIIAVVSAQFQKLSSVYAAVWRVQQDVSCINQGREQCRESREWPRCSMGVECSARVEKGRGAESPKREECLFTVFEARLS